MLIGLLVKYSKPLAMLALIAGLAAYRAVLVGERDRARRQVIVTQAEIAELQAANTQWRNATIAQNAAITQLSAAQARARAIAQKQDRAGRAHGAALMAAAARQAAALVGARVPKGCGAAIAWGNAQGPELAKW